MTQAQRRVYLIQELLKEQPTYRELEIPQGETEQRQLLRALCNLRAPQPISQEFLRIQDQYLQTRSCPPFPETRSWFSGREILRP